jgi:hypothetical protein
LPALIFRGEAAGPSERQALKHEADEISKKVFDLERLVTSAAYFLPAFDIRNLSNTVKELRGFLASVREKKLPHIPFAFSDPTSIVLVTDPLEQVRTPISLSFSNDALVVAKLSCCAQCCPPARKRLIQGPRLHFRYSAALDFEGL